MSQAKYQVGDTKYFFEGNQLSKGKIKFINESRHTSAAGVEVHISYSVEVDESVHLKIDSYEWENVAPTRLVTVGEDYLFNQSQLQEYLETLSQNIP